MSAKITAIGLLAVATMNAAAWGEGSGDAFRGQSYAQTLCASCHDVSVQGGSSPNPAAKPFSAVTPAADTGEGFAAWLNTKHPLIQNYMIRTAQAEDLLAYIASTKHPAP